MSCWVNYKITQCKILAPKRLKTFKNIFAISTLLWFNEFFLNSVTSLASVLKELRISFCLTLAYSVYSGNWLLNYIYYVNIYSYKWVWIYSYVYVYTNVILFVFHKCFWFNFSGIVDVGPDSWESALIHSMPKKNVGSDPTNYRQ